MQANTPDQEQPSVQSTTTSTITATDSTNIAATAPGQFRVIRRNGKVTAFDGEKISIAMTKAFLAVEGGNAAASNRIHEIVKNLTVQVSHALTRRIPDGGTFHIEDIQDQVELALMRGGHQQISRAYVIYRDEHARARAQEQALEAEQNEAATSTINVTLEDGSIVSLDGKRLHAIVTEACEGLESVDAQAILDDTERNLFDGVPYKDVARMLVMSARTLIEKQPDYGYAASRLLLDDLRTEALSFVYNKPCNATQTEIKTQYAGYFGAYIKRAIDVELLDPRLAEYDLEFLGKQLDASRDLQFTYLGLQTLYDRYFIHSEDTRFELPQAFFMRVAMGLALNEINREQSAVEFYRLLSSFDFMSSTPTLFNSGTLRPQLSSCYLTTIPDDLDGIFSSIKDDALLSKYAGGLGNDWTRVRGMGAHIKGTNGKSQGVVPFLKVANDTAVAVNQGGKRKGAMCAYLETWHIDIEEFLELRKNTGDDRRRTHDMNTANWIPDLFMKRVAEDKEWTLFSPNEAPELHELCGKKFEKAYKAYEKKAAKGGMRVYKTVQATTLWRKMISMLFETGHPWVTFKDPCNLRYSNQHVGVVHSSNLCTEIMLHTSDQEIAVCNLGSVNLPAHINDNGLDTEKLENTINTAMRMLDNVIDYNFYSVPEARDSNLRHRPVGMGVMGFQDALYKQRTPYASEEAVEFADRTMEAISYFAIKASTNLAEERGRYSTFDGSLWSKGVLPIDSIDYLAEGRGNYLDVDRSHTFDWDSLRDRVQKVGMRNSNTMAIAPTATISNICGYLISDLRERGLWDEVMANDLKYYDGSVQQIDRVPQDLKAQYQTAFELDARWLVEAASRRQKWIDQGQSLNLYMSEPNGQKLDALYKLAWVRGLKTTYYLRSMGATHVEKSTMDASRSSGLNAVDNTTATEMAGSQTPKACSILDPDCDACQ
jgi:ribonucleoside-diphosphate reductase alpha chain